LEDDPGASPVCDYRNHSVWWSELVPLALRAISLDDGGKGLKAKALVQAARGSPVGGVLHERVDIDTGLVWELPKASLEQRTAYSTPSGLGANGKRPDPPLRL
jgi:hypothetical protein